MSATRYQPRYSLAEEIANSVTHGVGIVLAIIGLAVLIRFGVPFYLIP